MRYFLHHYLDTLSMWKSTHSDCTIPPQTCPQPNFAQAGHAAAPGIDGIMASRHRFGGYKDHKTDLERRSPLTLTATTSSMTYGTKCDGPPLQGGPAKVLILGTTDNRMPFVAHPQESADEAQAPDVLCGADAEGCHFNCFCYFT